MKSTIQSSSLLLLVLSFTFFSCKKIEVIQNNPTFNESESIKNESYPLVIASSDKSTTVINAITGSVINYYKFLGEKKGNQSQSSLFTDSLIINFFGNTVTAMGKKDSTIKWKTLLYPNYNGNGYQYTSYPCINNKLVMFYVELNPFTHKYGFYGLDLRNGKIAWTNTDFIGSTSVPAYTTNTLVVNGYNFISLLGYIYAIDANTGKTKWAIIDSSRVNPACTDGTKFFYSARTETFDFGDFDTLFSRNTADGSLNWKIALPGISGSPLISGDHLYINLENELLCIDKNTGKEIWKFTESDSNFLGFNEPYASDGKIFVTGSANISTDLFALNESDGEKLWAAKIINYYYPEGPVVMNGNVYLRDGQNNIDAFESNTGNLIFQTRINYYQTGNPEYSPTYVDANGKMVYSTASGMH